MLSPPGANAGPDAGTVILDGKTVTFDLPTDQPIVGVDFNPGFYAKNLVFTLDGPDGPIADNLIHLGSKGAKSGNPIFLVKEPQGS